MSPVSSPPPFPSSRRLQHAFSVVIPAQFTNSTFQLIPTLCRLSDLFPETGTVVNFFPANQRVDEDRRIFHRGTVRLCVWNCGFSADRRLCDRRRASFAALPAAESDKRSRNCCQVVLLTLTHTRRVGNLLFLIVIRLDLPTYLQLLPPLPLVTVRMTAAIPIRLSSCS